MSPMAYTPGASVSQTSFTSSISLGNAISNGLKNKYTYAYDALHGGFKLYLSDFINEENYDLLSINILNDWPISVRTYNALKEENIIFLGDLITYTESNNSFASLLRIKNWLDQNINVFGSQIKEKTSLLSTRPSKCENNGN